MELENRLFDVSKFEEKLKSIKSLSDLTGPNGVIQEIIKSTVELILRAEQEAHLGFEPHEMTATPKDNDRNGYSKKTIKTSSGEVEYDPTLYRTSNPHGTSLYGFKASQRICQRYERWKLYTGNFDNSQKQRGLSQRMILLKKCFIL